MLILSREKQDYNYLAICNFDTNGYDLHLVPLGPLLGQWA